MAEIDDYLAGLDEHDATIIGDAYAKARALVPEAEQGVGYGMPALVVSSKPLLSVMRAKGHFGLYPFSAVVVAKVIDSLSQVEGLTSAKGTIRLPLGTPIPEIVISELVLIRHDEILQSLSKKPKPRARVAKHED
jgi:uncharacterized protein YdhG (YjbR/CyaY superfamily)